MKTIGSVFCTHGILRAVPAVKTFWNNVQPISFYSLFGKKDNQGAVLCWGTKPSAKKAVRFADKSKLNLVRLEDGFIRSTGLGVDGEPALSLYVDPVGVYYDATKPSQVENILASDETLSSLFPQAIAAMELIVANKISKYNQVVPYSCQTIALNLGSGAVLVVDQTVGDQSVTKGLADVHSFKRMLQAARKENPGKKIIIKRHPDVVAGAKSGYLDDVEEDATTIVVSECLPYDLFQVVDKVYTVTSQMGFEALMAGKSVVCFGVPFYAGWGVTDDRVSVPRRGKYRSVPAIFAAAYLKCCRYVDPVTWEEGDISKVINHIIFQRKKRAANKCQTVCIDMSWWKHQVVTPFLRSGKENEIKNCSLESLNACGLHFDKQTRLVFWGSKNRHLQDAFMGASEICFMEDGFLRSVGLGSDLVPPLSLVVDRQGLYYDSNKPSDLELLLEGHQFNDALIERARRLKITLTAFRITKYNLGGLQHNLSLGKTNNKKVALVIGQVPGDASLKYGHNGGPVNDYELMVAVKDGNPDLFVVYKPHPDVLSGNRKGDGFVCAASGLADLTLPNADTLDLIEQCDEVHTMTSLTGFEALVRDKKVVCYGMPFYAGWGLTEDKTSLLNERRSRKLTIDELIAGSLILYPHYIHPVTHDFLTVEDAVRVLIRQKMHSNQSVTKEISHGLIKKQWNKLRFLAAQSPGPKGKKLIHWMGGTAHV